MYSGIGETPFQPTTQTVNSFAEDVNSKRQIKEMLTKNKICSNHGHSLDESHTNHSCCPGVCGVNLPMQHTMGDEYTWASKGMAGLLSLDGVEVKEVTTDPDSGAGQAGESLVKGGLQENISTHNLNTRHLSENIRKSIKRYDKLLQIMLKRTNAEKTKVCFGCS